MGDSTLLNQQKKRNLRNLGQAYVDVAIQAKNIHGLNDGTSEMLGYMVNQQKKALARMTKKSEPIQRNWATTCVPKLCGFPMIPISGPLSH